MPLSDLRIRKAKPKDKPYKISDSNGLYIYVTPAGSRVWRMDYAHRGKRKTLTLGRYPATSLIDARNLHVENQSLLERDIDPSSHRKKEKRRQKMDAENTFGMIADEYLERMVKKGRAPTTVAKNQWFKSLIDADVLEMPITEVTSADILEVLQPIEASGRRDTAHGVRAFCGSVFRHAISTVRAETDPTIALRGALLPPMVSSYSAITDPEDIGALMNSIDEYDGWITLRYALQFTALTFARPGEVRKAQWSEIDMEDAVWSIPAERMKMRRPHDVPLSNQAAVTLNRMRKISGKGRLIFPSMRSADRPLSENAMNSALRRMGYAKEEMMSHGFRAMASTELNERGFREDVVETQLAHLEPNKVRRVYNRAKYWDERVVLMQAWADLLNRFKRG